MLYLDENVARHMFASVIYQGVASFSSGNFCHLIRYLAEKVFLGLIDAETRETFLKSVCRETNFTLRGRTVWPAVVIDRLPVDATQFKRL